jgi:hypothetical protein
MANNNGNQFRDDEIVVLTENRDGRLVKSIHPKIGVRLRLAHEQNRQISIATFEMVLGKDLKSFLSGLENLDRSKFRGFLGEVPVESGKLFSSSARCKVKGISEVKPILVPRESLRHSLRVFRFQVGKAEQILKSLGYDFL